MQRIERMDSQRATPTRVLHGTVRRTPNGEDGRSLVDGIGGSSDT
jgi:hypothetical protein